MGWYGKVLEVGDLIKKFIDIKTLKDMNMCQIISIYLNENKIGGKKTDFYSGTWNW